MRRVLILFAVTIALVAAQGDPVRACSCFGPMPPCQATWQADAVFVGEVLESAVTPEPAGQPVSAARGPVRVRFRIAERFRGEFDGDTVDVYTPGLGNSCDLPFDARGVYLVYAYRNADTGRLGTGLCTRTRPAASAMEDIVYLRGPAREPSALGLIQGTATRTDPDNSGQMWKAPFADARVVIEASGAPQPTRYETRTAADGTYRVRVPPGRYTATLEPGAGLYAEYRGLPLVELLDGRGCAATDFSVRSDGRLRGRVVDAEGRPVPFLGVDAMSARWSLGGPYGAKPRSVTDATGAFEFERIAPGDYFIGLNVHRELREPPGTVAWFARRPASAPEAIAVASEAQVTIGDFRLPASIALARLEGVVIDPAGRPVEGVSVHLLTPACCRIAAGPVLTDRDGRFMITAIAGLEYRVSASLFTAPGQGRRAESDVFSARADLPAFRLQLNR